MICQLRRMKKEDLRMAHQWRNDPRVRYAAASDVEISFEEFEAVFNYSNQVFYIFEMDYEPMGFIGVMPSESKVTGIWSFHLAPEARGKNYSPVMLGMVLIELHSQGYQKIVAEVKPDNYPSLKIHDKWGFQIVETRPDMVILEKYFGIL